MSEQINCIIIEDEKPASEILELYISKIDFLQLNGCFSNISQALPCLNLEKIDLIFLDINLPGINGINFVKTMHPTAGIIFTTACPEHAVEGFELDAIDYLLKPISSDRFIKAINKFLKSTATEKSISNLETIKPEQPFIFIKCERRMVKIFLDDILYFEAQKNYIDIFTVKETYRAYTSISDMEEKIPGQMFLRVHRSFIVSLEKIDGFSTTTIEINKAKIPIGRHYSMQTLNILNGMINDNIKLNMI